MPLEDQTAGDCTLPARFRVALVRHGQTPANREDRFSGRIEEPLTPAGRLMAIAAAESPLLAGIERVFCSPQTRASDTAKLIAERMGLPPPVVDDDFRELDFGTWDGCQIAPISTTRHYRRWSENPFFVGPPGGETGSSVLNRSYRALCRALAACPNSAIVTHKSPARLLTAALTDSDVNRYRELKGFFASSITVISVEDGRVSSIIPADISHLPVNWRSDPDRLRTHHDNLAELEV